MADQKNWMTRIEEAVTTETSKIRAEVVDELHKIATEAKAITVQTDRVAKEVYDTLKNDLVAVWQKLHDADHVEQAVTQATAQAKTDAPEPPTTSPQS